MTCPKNGVLNALMTAGEFTKNLENLYWRVILRFIFVRLTMACCILSLLGGC